MQHGLSERWGNNRATDGEPEPESSDQVPEGQEQSRGPFRAVSQRHASLAAGLATFRPTMTAAGFAGLGDGLRIRRGGRAITICGLLVSTQVCTGSGVAPMFWPVMTTPCPKG
jgi:hypothetical protein